MQNDNGSSKIKCFSPGWKIADRIIELVTSSIFLVSALSWNGALQTWKWRQSHTAAYTICMLLAATVIYTLFGYVRFKYNFRKIQQNGYDPTYAFLDKLMTLVASSFSFVASLHLNEAIKSLLASVNIDSAWLNAIVTNFLGLGVLVVFSYLEFKSVRKKTKCTTEDNPVRDEESPFLSPHQLASEMRSRNVQYGPKKNMKTSTNTRVPSRDTSGYNKLLRNKLSL